jgi:phage terminase large subunit-like protein
LISQLTEEQIQVLLYDWRIWARDSQLPPPGDWFVWLALAGRGWGKTWVGSNWIIEQVKDGAKRLMLVAPTAGDVRDLMVDGNSGIQTLSEPNFCPRYEPSKSRLVWPNGAMANLRSADVPDRVRGYNNEVAWAEEMASWRRFDAWDQLKLTVRIGKRPRIIVTTTPKPVPAVVELMKSENCIVTRGSTYENKDNLAPDFFRQIVGQYEGTNLGRQEIYAEILEEQAGALWTRELIEKCRISIQDYEDRKPELQQIVVGVDPAASTKAETGIIVAGKARSWDDQWHGYVLDDVTVRGTPEQWAKAVVQAYHDYKADLIVAEKNQGGDMVESILRSIDPNLPIKLIHASKGKQARAQPVAALYERGRVHHKGFFAQLESQMTTWVPNETRESPDRLDSMSYCITELLLGARQETFWEAIAKEILAGQQAEAEKIPTAAGIEG